MKKSIYLLLCLLVVSCNSQEHKAYKNAISSNDLGVLRNYLSSNEGDLPKAHFEKASATLKVLVIDSTSYSNFVATEDTIKKYNICREFLDHNIKGPHTSELNGFEKDFREYYYKTEGLRYEEIDSMEPSFKSYNMYLKYLADFPYGHNKEDAEAFIEHNKDFHQKMTAELNKMKKAFANYTFDGYDISGPDEYGEGTFKKTTTYNFRVDYPFSGYRIAVVTQKFTGKYYVDEELLIHADITEEISYKPRPGSNYGADGNRELMADMKDEFPSPVVQHHCVCDLTSYGGGTYVLSVQESGKETEFYDGILK